MRRAITPTDAPTRKHITTFVVTANNPHSQALALYGMPSTSPIVMAGAITVMTNENQNRAALPCGSKPKSHVAVITASNVITAPTAASDKPKMRANLFTGRANAV